MKVRVCASTLYHFGFRVECVRKIPSVFSLQHSKEKII